MALKQRYVWSLSALETTVIGIAVIPFHPRRTVASLPIEKINQNVRVLGICFSSLNVYLLVGYPGHQENRSWCLV